jgi:O-antigen/teichoic acid export membrane protein
MCNRKITVLSWFKQLYTNHLPHNSLRRSLASGAFWSLAGEIGLRSLTVLAGIVVARILGKHIYGQWGVIMGAAVMFGSLGGLGMATAAAKYIAELKKNDPMRAGRALSLILLIGLVGVLITSITCLCLAKLMAYRLYHAPELFIPLMVASAMLFCIMGALILQGVMAGFEDFKGIARINLVQGITFFISIILLAYFLGLVGAVIAMAVSQGTALVLYLLSIRKQCYKHNIRISKKHIWKESRIIWHYAAPGFLTSSVLHPARMFSHALVANTQGGFAGLGSYNAAERWQALVLFIPRSVKRITLPMLSRLHGNTDYKRFLKALWANVVLNGCIALAGALPIMLLSPWILSLYGRDFRQDWDILVILVGMAIFQSVIEVLSQLLACMEKMWWNFGFHVVYGAIILGGSYLLVPNYGVRGFLWAYAVATIIHMLNHIWGTTVLLRRCCHSLAAKTTADESELHDCV